MSYYMLSNCCGAPPKFPLQIGEGGICSKCGEHTEFHDEDEEEVDDVSC